MTNNNRSTAATFRHEKEGGRTAAFYPCLDGDAGEDDGRAYPLARCELVVVYDDREKHRK